MGAAHVCSQVVSLIPKRSIRLSERKVDGIISSDDDDLEDPFHAVRGLRDAWVLLVSFGARRDIGSGETGTSQRD